MLDKYNKEIFDGLMKVADFNITRFDQRRNHNWKVSLGFWAAILGSATLLDTMASSIDVCPQILAAIMVWILHTYWLVKVFQADKKDKVIAFKARDIAITLLNTELKPPRFTVENEKAILDWSVRFQSITTFLLLFTLLFIINT